jgi:2'-5' RNA ligase
MAHSVLLIPVPELETVVRSRLPDEAVAVDPETVHAHITLLGPFAPHDAITDGLRSELRSLFGDVTPFRFELTEVCRFPAGTWYLSPEPATPFRQLTLALSRRFPEYPPYGGAFDDVVPHLTLPGDEEPFGMRQRLPASARAAEAALFWFEPGASRTLDVFPFGTSAA